MTLMRQKAGDVYWKRHANEIENDWNRVCLFAKIVGQVDSVETARPLWLDVEKSFIAYERLHELQPLLSNRDLSADIFYRLGGMLARFHAVPIKQPDNGSNESAYADYPLRSLGMVDQEVRILERNIPSGMFYGDCWHGNVFLDTEGRFIFLDPLPNTWMFDSSYIRANGAIDLAMMHMSLFFCHPLHKSMAGRTEAMIACGRALVDGYIDVLSAHDSQATIMRLSRNLSCRYLGAYRARLLWPLAVIKQLCARYVMYQLDKKYRW